jgi:Glycosyltransferase sugar-binding region containing DXD motif
MVVSLPKPKSLTMATFRPYNQRIWALAFFFFLLFLGFQLWTPLQSGAISIVESFPYASDRNIDTYNFETTAFEDSCLHGTHPNYTGASPIPNIVHFVIGLHDSALSFPSYLSIHSALISIAPDRLKLHHTGLLDTSDKYVQSLLSESPAVQLVRHDAEAVRAEMLGKSDHYAHIADALRLKVLRDEGGIYLDADIYVLQSFSDVLKSPPLLDVALGHEGGNRYGLCNAVIVARPHAAFILRWIDSYAEFHVGEWNEHSVVHPKDMANEHPAEVCLLSPHAFFWPTWTARHIRWIHEPLSKIEAEKFEQTLSENKGSIYRGQLAYHAWNSLAWGRYMWRLTEDVVKSEDTRFNLMVRRFLA